MKLSCFFIASACAQGDLFADDMLKSDFYGPISDEFQVKVQKPNDVECCSTLKVIFQPIFRSIEKLFISNLTDFDNYF